MDASQSKKYIVATDDTSTVLVRRNEATYYGNLLSIIHEYYPHIPVEVTVIQTNELPVSPREYDIASHLISFIPELSVRAASNVLASKPVIYLFTPQPMGAVVRLSIIKSWSFSAVYPGIPIKYSESGQSMEWNVNTHEDDTMTDLATGTRVSCLFWEAETNHGLPPSPPSSPQLGEPLNSHATTIFPFDPLLAELTDINSVVLPASKTVLYLDKALTALGLHVEARTSFITYWLPSILKHDFVALRFLPQASYEHAAPLDVKPKPDVVTRVFMLFKRVCEDGLDEWEGALSRASENVDVWKGVVGAEYDRMKDEALFRVLEWGGLEVKH
ncbi:hypothetical protein F5146DRAFT_1144831 [Armillaria mellea]|nr:hypothetical protein F5146DRAFT_1144831 [Armillaria mellea]